MAACECVGRDCIFKTNLNIGEKECATMNFYLNFKRAYLFFILQQRGKTYRYQTKKPSQNGVSSLRKAFPGHKKIDHVI